MNTFEKLHSLKSSCTTHHLVRSHSTDGLVEDLGWHSVTEGAGFIRVDNVVFVEGKVQWAGWRLGRRHK
jgi:hypothetical protein